MFVFASTFYELKCELKAVQAKYDLLHDMFRKQRIENDLLKKKLGCTCCVEVEQPKPVAKKDEPLVIDGQGVIIKGQFFSPAQLRELLRDVVGQRVKDEEED